MGRSVSIFRSLALLLGVALLCLSPRTFASVADPDLKDGYIPSVEEDKNADDIQDVVLIPKPEAKKKSIPLSDEIFDQKLTHEFTERYREQFGYTDAQQDLTTPIAYEVNSAAQGRSLQDEADRGNRQTFAEYMFRRLGEYHMDNYFRSEPSLKGAWEFKERISNYEVKMANGMSVMTVYSFSGNFITVNVNNPYVGSQIRVEMDPSSFGPTQVQEGIVSLSKDVGHAVTLETHYKVYDGVLTLVGRKQLTPIMNVTLTGSSDFSPVGPYPQQNLILAGFSYTY